MVLCLRPGAEGVHGVTNNIKASNGSNGVTNGGNRDDGGSGSNGGVTNSRQQSWFPTTKYINNDNEYSTHTWFPMTKRSRWETSTRCQTTVYKVSGLNCEN
jgi:hypothetical protein